MDNRKAFPQALWEKPAFRAVAGGVWRPGGVALTRAALDWCEGAGLVQASPATLALDCGTGAGATARLLSGRGYRVLGLDLRAGLDGEIGTAAPAGLVRADFCQMPLVANCVGLVFFECVLSLAEHPEAALKEAWRVLQPGGILVFSDLCLRERAHRIAPPPEPAPPGSSCLAGARSVADWERLLAQSGFRILKRENHDRALALLAAQMIWQGAGDALCSCGLTHPNRFGYALWIGRKREKGLVDY